MGTTCKRFVSGSDYTSDYLSLDDGPADKPSRGASHDAAQHQQVEREQNRQKSTERDSGP